MDVFKKSNVSSTRLCSFFRGITLHSCKWSFCLLLRHHTYSSTFCFLRCKCDFLTSYYERWCNNSLSFTHTHLHLHILLILSPILHYNCIVILFRSFIFFKDIIFFFFNFLDMPCSIQDLSSPARDGTHISCSGSVES